MTRDGEIAVLREHLATCARLRDRLAVVRARIDALIPLTAERLAALDSDADIDVLAFLKTYEQFEDTLGRTLKTIVMMVQFGKRETLSARTVALRAVALGIFDDGKEWADAVRVRNELAHEYPLRPDKQAAQVNSAWRMCDTLNNTANAIVAFVDRERLLHGDL